MALRCLSVQSVKDLSDFLARERLAPPEGEDLPVRLFPCTLFLDGATPALEERLIEAVGGVGGWARRLRKERTPRQSGGALLLCAAPEALGRLAAGLRGGEEMVLAARRIGAAAGALSRRAPEPVRYGGRTLDFSGGPLVMGVLNVTPDSFYDGGHYLDTARADRQAMRLIEEGADILDVGGASTRPGSDRVPDSEQIRRVVPVIRAVRRRWDGWVSVDTYAAAVARAALEEGADMINDISAGGMDPEIRGVAARAGAPAVLMHMRGTPRDMQRDPYYESLFGEIIDSLEASIGAWVEAGCLLENLLIDPGIGFGKNLEHNLRILRHLREFEVLGRPLVLGTSRKSFIGAVLGRQDKDRLVGTLATLAIGAWNGAHVFRVHDVAEAREALAVVAAIQRA